MTRRTLLAFSTLAALAAGCRDKPVGQLVVSIQTDMSIPEQIDTVRVQVLVRGVRQLDQDYPVGTTDENRIPGTLTLLGGKDPSAPVTIRVAGGKHSGNWRTFREVITTIPADRTAYLRMPMQWLCDGTAVAATEPDPFGDRAVVKSTCGDGNSCVAGRCTPSPVANASLPPFQASQVFGGSADPNQGTCFDTVACMAIGAVSEPRDGDCTIPRPVGGQGVNVALRVTSDGICDQTGTICFVPLDGNSREGWSLTTAGDRIALPPAACQKLRAGVVSGVYVSTGCSTKTEAIPPCGKWSSVRTAAPVAVDAGVPESATKVLSLADGSTGGVPCCPLLSSGANFYTCLCPTRAVTHLVSIDPATAQVRPVRDLPAPADRLSPYFGAALLDDTVFWVDAVANTVHRTPLSGEEKLPPVQIKGEISEATPLLVDGSAMYLLALAVVGAQGAPVQLLKIDRGTGDVRAFDTGANFHVHQFAQDATSIYVVSDRDTEPDAGTTVQRQSRVVRISKADGSMTDVSDTMTVTTTDRLHGGYIGVFSDATGGDSVYSLYEEGPAADGTVITRLVKLALAARTSTTLLERNLEPARASLWLLGVVDGSVLAARTEAETADAGESPVRSSSLIVLPARGGPARILADLQHDYPLLGLNALAQDVSHVYWLNSSGDLMRFPRGGLQ
jgi:hypothetical protein